MCGHSNNPNHTVGTANAAAALKHHFKDRDDVLKRMLPWTKLRT